MAELWRIADHRRAQFDAAALDYHRYRPRYPEGLFDDIVGLAALGPGASVVDVGAGTGFASGPLADRGFDVTAIEPAPAMTALGQEVTGDRARWIAGRFEDWSPDRTVDLVVSCNAWHWIEPERGVEQVAAVLRPGGAVAIVWTDVAEWGADPFERRLAETFGAPWPKGLDAVHGSLAALDGDGRFGPFEVRRHRFERTLDAADLVAVTRTYGGPYSEERDKALAGLVDELGGAVTKVEEAVLHLARRLE